MVKIEGDIATMIRMMYVGTHVHNVQDSMYLIFRVAESLGIEVYWAADFSKFKGCIEDIPCHVLQTDFSRHPMISKNNLRAIRQLRRYIRENNIDFVHCNTPIGSFCGRIASRMEKIHPVLYTAHGLPYYHGAPVTRNVFKVIEYFLSFFTDYAVAMNEEDYLALQKLPLRKKRVYKINGVGIPLQENHPKVRMDKRAELGIDASTPVVICVGRLEKIKGVDISLRAFAAVSSKDAVLLICGEGVEKEKLIQLAIELGIQDRVRFLGFRTDVYDLLSASDCYLLNSFYEGLPRSLMEAMNAKVACVVSKARGNIDLIHDQVNGLVVDIGDVAQTTEALNSLLSSPSDRKRYIDQAYSDVQQYGMDVVYDQYREIYRDMLGI